MRLPSVKTIESGLKISKEDAKRIREILEDFRDRFPTGLKYNELHKEFRVVAPKETLGKVSDILGHFGYDQIARGNNSRSPEIHYSDTGRTYDQTILYCNGNFSVGSWGAIVERGNYQ